MWQTTKDYKADLNQRYWNYEESQFLMGHNYFERPYVQDGRPPVFIRKEAQRNIILNPTADHEETNRLLALIPEGERHRWFGSMNSSQALAQSVFGNLAIYNSLHYLSELKDDEGMDLFGKAQISSDNFAMEHKINYLGERRRTSLDCYISGEFQIAIECKFTETEVGTCSRPRLKPTASNYDKEYCNGSYSRQKARTKRCSLTDIGVSYWMYAPQLFNWKDDYDLNPCPLNNNYQLVRNILAVGVRPNESVSVNNGLVIVIYDERNPSVQKNGHVLMSYMATREALIEPTMLRKCSWQRIVKHLRENNILFWLTENLASKYGL